MERGADLLISNNERKFIAEAVAQERRLDGRAPTAMRDPQFSFSMDGTSATVQQGQTRAMSVVTATLEAPFPERPNEGTLRFDVELGPMASPSFEPGRPGEQAVEMARIVERALRQSKAVDLEALCVQAERKVWWLRVVTHVLDHGGNLVDVACLSALAALLAFRKPATSLDPEGGEVVIHPPEEREPSKLSLLHRPISVTFALFQGGDIVLVDPTLSEEAAAEGSLTLVVTPLKQICAVQKASGCGVTPDQLMLCVRVAGSRAEAVAQLLDRAMEAHDLVRAASRVRRKGDAGSGPRGLLEGERGVLEGGPGRSLAVLDAAAVQPEEDALRRGIDDLDMGGDTSSSSDGSDDDNSSGESSSEEPDHAAPAAAGAPSATSRLVDMSAATAAAGGPSAAKRGPRQSPQPSAAAAAANLLTGARPSKVRRYLPDESSDLAAISAIIAGATTGTTSGGSSAGAAKAAVAAAAASAPLQDLSGAVKPRAGKKQQRL